MYAIKDKQKNLKESLEKTPQKHNITFKRVTD